MPKRPGASLDGAERIETEEEGFADVDVVVVDVDDNALLRRACSRVALLAAAAISRLSHHIKMI